METKHTPGPWHVGMRPGPMIYGPKGEQVADLSADLLMVEERQANLRLIAAAPDLLEALTDALGMLDHYMSGRADNWDGSTKGQARSTLVDGRAAIAKARGESSSRITPGQSYKDINR